MDKYQQAEANRSKALAFINKNPGCVRIDVAIHMGMSRTRTGQMLMRMEELGDIRREDGGVGLKNRKSMKLFALMEETATAEDIKRHLTGNLKAPGVGRPVVRSYSAPINKPEVKPVARLFGGL